MRPKKTRSCGKNPAVLIVFRCQRSWPHSRTELIFFLSCSGWRISLKWKINEKMNKLVRLLTVQNIKCFIRNVVSSTKIGKQKDARTSSFEYLGRLRRVYLIIWVSCPYVRPSTKSFSNSDEIWYVGRGRWMMHDGMPCNPIQGQGQSHETFKVRNSSIFKIYLLPHF